MTETKRLEGQIAALKARRAELAAAAARAHGTFETARAGLVAGRGRGDVAGVTKAQATSGAVEAALADVDSQLEGLRQQLGQTRAEEERERKRARIAELEAEEGRLQAEWDAARSEGDALLAGVVARMSGIAVAFRRAAAEHERHVPLPSSALGLGRRLRDGPLRFGAAIAFAVQTVQAEEERLRRKAYTRAGRASSAP